MAKINLSVDTEKNTMVCDIDGKKVPDVQHATFCQYEYDGKCYVEICCKTKEIVDGINQVMRICTANKITAKDNVIGQSSDGSLKVTQSNDPIIDAVSRWMGK